MMLTGVLYLCLSLVTPSPGWSAPIVITEGPNTSRPELHLNMDDQAGSTSSGPVMEMKAESDTRRSFWMERLFILTL